MHKGRKDKHSRYYDESYEGKRKRLFLDIESTGFAPGKDSPYSIGGVIEVEGEIERIFDLHCRPCITHHLLQKSESFDDPFNERKVYTEAGVDALEKKGNPADTYDAFNKILGKYVLKGKKEKEAIDKFAIIGFNIERDIQVLKHWFYTWFNDRYFMSYVGSYVSCVYNLSGILWQENKIKLEEGNLKLEPVANFYKLPKEVDTEWIPKEKQYYHNAAYDAYQTRELYYYLTNKYMKG